MQHEKKGWYLGTALRLVDADAYGGWDGSDGCWACEKDIKKTAKVCSNYTSRIYINGQATHDAVLGWLYRMAEMALPGNLVFWHHSGHGGQRLDSSGDEADGFDETLVVWDREIVDDEVWMALKRFRSGVRIVALMDTCTSGTMYRGAPKPGRVLVPKPVRSEFSDLAADLIWMAGCRDGEASIGTREGGAFTLALMEAITRQPNPSWWSMYNYAHTKLSPHQVPQCTMIGQDFLSEAAFEI